MNTDTVSETVSQKPRRGRPRSAVREAADRYARMFSPEGCQRTNTNEAYRLRATGVAFDLEDAEQRVLFGSTKDEIWSGKGPGKFPPGWQTTAEEVGRFLVSIAADDDIAADYLRSIVQARRNGVRWRDIRSHFRKLRLGERTGNAVALTRELARTIDGFRSRFPATTDQAVAGAVRSLLELVSEETDTDSS